MAAEAEAAREARAKVGNSDFFTELTSVMSLLCKIL
jgi:hypothetical protein